jgi:AraC-like DNA-binding protein
MCILLTIQTGTIFVVHNFNVLGIAKIKNLYIIAAMSILFPMALFSLNAGDITPSLWLIVAPLCISVIQHGKKLVYWNIIVFSVLLIICGFPTILVICGNKTLTDLVQSLYKTLAYPEGVYIWYCLRFTKIISIFSNLALVCYAVYYKEQMYKVQLEELKDQLNRNNELDSKMKPIDEEDENKKYDKLYDTIVEYMENKQPFTKEDFSIAQLSIALNINTSYISSAIKIKQNINFSTFVNTYRIEKVKKMLQYNVKKYTLEHIYMSSGFKNQSTFNKAFKLYEGITPTEYIKKLHDAMTEFPE